MVLENFVRLKRDTEKVMRFRPGSFHVEDVTITDPKTKLPKRVRRAVVDVVEEDYRPVVKTFSTLAEKLAVQLAQLHDTGELYRYRVGVTWHPQDLATEYTVRIF